MNRSFISVIAGGFRIEAGPAEDKDYDEHREITADVAAYFDPSALEVADVRRAGFIFTAKSSV